MRSSRAKESAVTAARLFTDQSAVKLPVQMTEPSR